MYLTRRSDRERKRISLSNLIVKNWQRQIYSENDTIKESKKEKRKEKTKKIET